MSTIRAILSRALPVACVVLAASSLALAPARPVRPVRARRAAVRRQAAPQAQPIVFGDVTLSRFRTVTVELGKFAEAVGPNTTLDTVDEKSGAKSQLQAAKLTAYANPQAPNQVSRVEADGNVRFLQTRPDPGGKGTMTARANGAKGVYNKVTGIVTLTGPVNFRGEQPTADGKGTQWVDGRAREAVYDEGKQILTFTGGVDAKVMAPDVMREPSPLVCQKVTINLSARPYKYTIENLDTEGMIRVQPREQKK